MVSRHKKPPDNLRITQLDLFLEDKKILDADNAIWAELIESSPKQGAIQTRDSGRFGYISSSFGQGFNLQLIKDLFTIGTAGYSYKDGGGEINVKYFVALSTDAHFMHAVRYTGDYNCQILFEEIKINRKMAVHIQYPIDGVTPAVLLCVLYYMYWNQCGIFATTTQNH